MMCSEFDPYKEFNTEVNIACMNALQSLLAPNAEGDVKHPLIRVQIVKTKSDGTLVGKVFLCVRCDINWQKLGIVRSRYQHKGKSTRGYYMDLTRFLSFSAIYAFYCAGAMTVIREYLVGKHWIQNAIKHPGRLTHIAKRLHGLNKEGHISGTGYKHLTAYAKDHPSIRHALALAHTLKHMHHGEEHHTPQAAPAATQISALFPSDQMEKAEDWPAFDKLPVHMRLVAFDGSNTMLVYRYRPADRHLFWKFNPAVVNVADFLNKLTTVYENFTKRGEEYWTATKNSHDAALIADCEMDVNTTTHLLPHVPPEKPVKLIRSRVQNNSIEQDTVGTTRFFKFNPVQVMVSPFFKELHKWGVETVTEKKREKSPKRAKTWKDRVTKFFKHRKEMIPKVPTDITVQLVEDVDHYIQEKPKISVPFKQAYESKQQRRLAIEMFLIEKYIRKSPPLPTPGPAPPVPVPEPPPRQIPNRTTVHTLVRMEPIPAPTEVKVATLEETAALVEKLEKMAKKVGKEAMPTDHALRRRLIADVLNPYRNIQSSSLVASIIPELLLLESNAAKTSAEKLRLLNGDIFIWIFDNMIPSMRAVVSRTQMYNVDVEVSKIVQYKADLHVVPAGQSWLELDIVMPAWLRLLITEANADYADKYNFETFAPAWLTSRLGYDFSPFPIDNILEKLEEQILAGTPVETPWLVMPY